MAALQIAEFRGMRSGSVVDRSRLAGARTLVSAGVADPWTFAAQLRALGADVTLWPWPDHHGYAPGDVARLTSRAATFDYVVVTEKDAVKLGALWPCGAPQPIVAMLELTWDTGGQEVETLLSRFTTFTYDGHPSRGTAATHESHH